MRFQCNVLRERAWPATPQGLMDVLHLRLRVALLHLGGAAGGWRGSKYTGVQGKVQGGAHRPRALSGVAPRCQARALHQSALRVLQLLGIPPRVGVFLRREREREKQRSFTDKKRLVLKLI